MKRTHFFLMACLLTLAACNNAQSPKEMSFDEVMKTRRSVRSYDAARTIPQEKVRELMETVLEAPSWANTQSSRYYIVMNDAQKLEDLKKMTLANYNKVSGAPVMVVSTFVSGQAGFRQGVPTNEVGAGWGAYDNGLSNAYFILKARQMGYDTLIMGMRDADAIRALLGIPEEETLMAVISLGYRDGEPRSPKHKSVDEMTRFF